MADGDGSEPRRSARSRRRARRVAAGWVAVVALASVVDPGAVASLWRQPTAAGEAVATATAETSDGPLGLDVVLLDAFVLSHLLAYGVLAWLVADGLGVEEGRRPLLRVALLAVAVAAAVGLGVELVQSPLAARAASASDAVVNGIGAAVGAGAWGTVRAARRETSG